MHAFLLPPLFSALSLLFHKSHCRSSLVNGDLKQAPLNCRGPRVAYMMSTGGKVRVTSSTVMKTHAARVQYRVFYNSAGRRRRQSELRFFFFSLGATQHVCV